MAKANKISIDDVLRAIKPVLPIIHDATRCGNWDGIGGVKIQIDPKENNVFKYVAQHGGQKLCDLALEECLKVVIEGTRNSHNFDVLRTFAEKYTKVVINLAEKSPQIFQTNDVANTCINGISGTSNKKKFTELVKNSREIQPEQQIAMAIG